MTFEKFMLKYNGKYVEVGGSANAKNQCVDLANAYIKEVLGLPMIFWTNAQDFPKKAGSKYTYIKNTPSGLPRYGDIIIWDMGSYGHIGMFISGNLSRFTSFDQNYPLGTPAHAQGHTYSNVIGWLRPKEEDLYKEKYEALLKKFNILEKENKVNYAERIAWVKIARTKEAELDKVNEMFEKSVADHADTQRLLSESEEENAELSTIIDELRKDTTIDVKTQYTPLQSFLVKIINKLTRKE